MAEFRETRKLNFQNKIVKLSDLQKLARTLSAEGKVLKKKKLAVDLEFQIIGNDGVIYESIDPLFFEDDSIFGLRKINKVSLSLAAFGGEPFARQYSVAVNITQTRFERETRSQNEIKVSGRDTAWVNGFLKIFEEIVNSFMPQDTSIKKFTSRFGFILCFILSLLFVYGLIALVQLILPRGILEQNPEWAAFLYRIPPLIIYAFIIGSNLFNASMWNKILINKVNDLWPSVEIQIGPDHELIEKKKRNLFAQVATLGILPLLLIILENIVSKF